MRPRRKSAALWGVVGALAFLSLHQAYLLLGGVFLGFAPIAGVAVVVFASTAVATYAAERRFGMFVRRIGATRRRRGRRDEN